MSELPIIENKIRKKEAEIRVLEAKVQAARIYVQALNDIRREMDGDTSDLKAGSMIANAREAIRKAGRPLHVDDLLVAIGRSAESKSSLTGSLAAYVRRGEIFTRPAPNTYGLVDLSADDADDELPASPPKGFGTEKPAVDPEYDDDVPF